MKKRISIPWAFRDVYKRQRYDEWRRIRNGQARVVIGPRSALFAPVQNVGLIVIDEEHEPVSYTHLDVYKRQPFP